MKNLASGELRSRVNSLLKSARGGSVLPSSATDDDIDHRPKKSDASEKTGLFMTLMYEPHSEEAKSFAAKLVDGMNQSSRGPKLAAQNALGIIAADLMRAVGEGPPTYLYRSVGAGTFVDSVVNWRPFTRACKALAEQGMLIVEPGVVAFAPGWKGLATRFHPTPALTDLAAKFGIDATEFGKHFRPVFARPKVQRPISLRAASKRQHGAYGHRIFGKPMTVDYADPVVVALARQVDEINGAIGNTPISAPHLGFRRIFNQGDEAGVHYDRGGRLYSIGGGYQQLSGDKRSRMTINGEPVKEWDISSSHLTIAMMKLGLPVPATGDLYAVPGIPRAIVKLYVNASLGNGKPIGKWPSDAIEQYARAGTPEKPNKIKESILADGYKYTGKLGTDWPVRLLTKKVLPHFPVLGLVKGAGINWGVLQFEESRVVVDAVHELCTIHGVVALPVHDSIICPASAAFLAKDVLARHFEDKIGATPTLRCK